ncbi:MAG: ORF6N domain-containing protein [Candidatus Doudnabacteria bacterium]|nr:ORF6N domain-containing protein [Candidatus Doudnabacteria bacterium]
MSNKTQIILADTIDSKILFIRGQKVILDSDLAYLYGVTTKRLNEQVKRNKKRFPEDFMFRLTIEEVTELNRSQIATGSQKHRDPRFRPYVFTEHGTVMLATILNSSVAIATSVQIVRAFVRLRSILAAHKELAKKVDQLEIVHNTDVKTLLELIQKYIRPKRKPSGLIGFRTK